MDKMLYYKDMTYGELGALDREKTVFFWSVSPIEVHGYHLPADTDVVIADELQKRFAGAISRKYPGYALVLLPPLCAGASALPVMGSIPVPARTLESIVYSFGKGLAEQGFKYLFISDNHGGPGHQLAIQSACNRLYKKYGFSAVDPFGEVFRRMVEGGEDFLALTGLTKGTCGDDADSHAGTNETSLVLAADEGRVRTGFRDIAPSLPPAVAGGAAAVMALSRLFGLLGARRTAGDLVHLANTLAWVGDKAMLPYMGDPSKASKEAGEAMLKAHTAIAMELFDRVLSGGRADIKPLLWPLRFLRLMPGA